jgi:uncharacterized protein Yka (UPF0111/DUF47 family)
MTEVFKSRLSKAAGHSYLDPHDPRGTIKPIPRSDLIDALREVFDAIDMVENSWEMGNLAGAVNNLTSVRDSMRPLIFPSYKTNRRQV